MKTAKKILYIFTTVIEALILIGAYMVNYFTHKKMGMLRHVIHKNYVWENTYPIATIQHISVIIMIVLMLLVLDLYIKRKYMLKKIVTIMNVVMVIFVLFFIGFTFVYSAEEVRAFYYISAMLGVVTLIQIIKTFIGVMLCKHEN